ncbi:uncharacterized protein SAPINGB_P005653 [Magnusiomyces paraingens]|uniref:Uncharacterized protein n=1 Tax=Magnusiomyces paraingens TaxID=2606893 RepID=A0A5E8C0Y4_9ASCO|nr:uncharacterized protein SAPINGB_P005653 [Saprochaete ingens]VVT57297.1 unnamed protein product [Saprochaete ingens]
MVSKKFFDDFFTSSISSDGYSIGPLSTSISIIETQTNIVTKYATTTQIDGSVTITTTIPCETSLETVVINPESTITLTEPCPKCIATTITSNEVVTLTLTNSNDQAVTVTSTEVISLIVEVTTAEYVYTVVTTTF